MDRVEVRPVPTEEEAAAIAAVVAVVVDAPGAAAPDANSQMSQWVNASRRAAQRSGLQRGPWRLAGRLGRRSRV
jgi:hypothetical protein